MIKEIDFAGKNSIELHKRLANENSCYVYLSKA